MRDGRWSVQVRRVLLTEMEWRKRFNIVDVFLIPSRSSKIGNDVRIREGGGCLLRE